MVVTGVMKETKAHGFYNHCNLCHHHNFKIKNANQFKTK